MSLESWDDRGVPELTARVVRASFPKGTLAVRVREALGPLFEDESFAEAFPARGRPAVSPGALALVSVLQYAEGLTDRQAADQVRARMDWKFLLGLELDDPGFDFSVLSDFRARLIEHGLEEKVLDLVLDRISRARAAARGGPAAHRLHPRAGGGADAEPDGVRRRDAAGGAGGPGRGRPAVAVRRWSPPAGPNATAPGSTPTASPRARTCARSGPSRSAGTASSVLEAVYAPGAPGLAAGDPRRAGPAPGLGRAVPP